METMIFAANAPASTSYLVVIGLAIAIVVGIIWAYRIYKDATGDIEDIATEPEEVLGPLSEAYAAGQMSEEEYERIRDSIVKTAGPNSKIAYMIRPKVVKTIHPAGLPEISPDPAITPPSVEPQGETSGPAGEGGTI